MDWHSRFLQQAAWTRDLRAYLFERAGLTQSRRVLEVGCGTGAILADLATPAAIHGLDLDPLRLTEAHKHAPAAALVCGNALTLPYPSGVFDITFCHFLLLWVCDPLQVLCEMKRITHPGGALLALAEPDYASRVDRPAVLAPLGRWQAESLRRQGADPALGSRLALLFGQAGIQTAETGSLQDSSGSGDGAPVPGQGTGRVDGQRLPAPSERDLEWAVLEADLAGSVPPQELSRMKLLDEQAWEQGERVLHVPTYFAWGIV